MYTFLEGEEATRVYNTGLSSLDEYSDKVLSNVDTHIIEQPADRYNIF